MELLVKAWIIQFVSESNNQKSRYASAWTGKNSEIDGNGWIAPTNLPMNAPAIPLRRLLFMLRIQSAVNDFNWTLHPWPFNDPSGQRYEKRHLQPALQPDQDTHPACALVFGLCRPSSVFRNHDVRRRDGHSALLERLNAVKRVWVKRTPAYTGCLLFTYCDIAVTT